MQNHLIIFARLPRLGTGKKRLARDLGALFALQFQQDNLRSLLRRVSNDPRWQISLTLTPEKKGYAVPYGVRRCIQPFGDLGQRMRAVMKSMKPHGPVLIIGSDIPGITREDIWKAFRLLQSHDAVLGPSEDGGYWAVGLRRRPHFFSPFDNVRWSTEYALQDTLNNLKGRRVGFLRLLRDIDTSEDLSQINYQRGRT